MRPLLPLAVTLVLSCAGPAPTVTPAPPLPSRAANEAPPSPGPPTTSAALPPPPLATTEVTPPAPPPDPPVDLGTFVRSLEQPVTSLGVGERRMAALGDEPWLMEDGVWKKIPFPARLRPRDGERDEGRIFFGRDDRPRIMGARLRPSGNTELYLRWRNAAWNEERGEIGKLRDPPHEAMWGVLGHADPEVVCKVSSDCIIKRRTGWKMMPAGIDRPRVELHGGLAWALGASTVSRLSADHDWLPLAPPSPLEGPSGVWGTTDEAWIAEAAPSRLRHVRAGAWTSEPSPVTAPRGMWGVSPSDVWLAGENGLAHYDGKTWSRVAGPTGPLTEVHGRGDEVWAAGPSGVWVKGAKTASH